MPVAFLTGGFRHIATLASKQCDRPRVRGVVYAHGHDLAHPLFVFGLWSAVALSVIAAVDLIHLSERRIRRATGTRSTAPPQSPT